MAKIDPSTLKITDMRFADIDGAPKRCTLIKLYTNQGLIGYGEVRDASSRTYAAMLKSRILGENPCNVDKIFRRIKQFGGHSRQAAASAASKSRSGISPEKPGASRSGSCSAGNSATGSASTAIPIRRAAAATWARRCGNAWRGDTPF